MNSIFSCPFFDTVFHRKQKKKTANKRHSKAQHSTAHMNQFRIIPNSHTHGYWTLHDCSITKLFCRDWKNKTKKEKQEEKKRVRRETQNCKVIISIIIIIVKSNVELMLHSKDARSNHETYRRKNRTMSQTHTIQKRKRRKNALYVSFCALWSDATIHANMFVPLCTCLIHVN